MDHLAIFLHAESARRRQHRHVKGGALVGHVEQGSKPLQPRHAHVAEGDGTAAVAGHWPPRRLGHAHED
eukprot:6533521-Heterocapsa_arctica.AAC.1